MHTPWRSLAACLLVAALTAALVPAPVAAQSQVTLTVSVVDQDGDPVSGAVVSATWNGGTGGPVNETTRANGQALVDVPEGADVTIAIDDDTYVRNTPVSVDDATSREVRVEVSEAAVATITAVDGNGTPVQNARVTLYRSGRFVTDKRTDEDGRMTSQRIEEGQYRVTVSKPGYFDTRVDRTLEGQPRREITIEEGSALVTFSVTDDHFEEPQPVRNATVTVGSVGSVQTLSNGEATLRVPVNDQYRATITKDGYETTRQTLTVRESETALNATIQRTPRLNLTSDNRRVVVGETARLTVRDEYGDPIEGVAIARNGSSVGTTNQNGVLTAAVPSAGPVEFSARSDSLSTSIVLEGVQAGDEGTPTPTPTGTPATPPPTASPPRHRRRGPAG
ncbi:carboxypeptidase regulatory-like domain-containing protein [Halomicroarcula sp. GCM10025709]|uniref:carboxypeptidase regulatory-like domain-containing protein n=1 Tax=Halomicroarcula sp. GCM10025709 TaxID=3252669 RepID=UPI0036064829